MRNFARADARFNLLGWAAVIVVVLLWQLLVGTKIIDFAYLPSPLDVAGGLREIVSDGSLWSQIAHTVRAALIASLIAVGVGVTLGVLIGMFRPVAVATSTTIDFMRSIPAVALMPVILLLMGASSRSEIVVGAFAGLWPILLSTTGGVQAINPRLHEVSRVLHLSRTERVFKILVPSAVPAILVGVRLTVVTCLVVVIIAEFLINPAGVGWALQQAQSALRPDVLFAYAFVTGLLGYLINVALIVGVRLCMPGSPALRSRA